MTEAGSGKPNLDFGEREVVLRADFDDLDDEHCLFTSLRFMLQGPRHPRQGEWVYLVDENGRGCLGFVSEVHGWQARICPDWASWVPASDRPAGAPPLEGTAT